MLLPEIALFAIKFPVIVPATMLLPRMAFATMLLPETAPSAIKLPAQNGLRPIVEFMTWNFATLALDQILNTASKMLEYRDWETDRKSVV